MYTISYANFRRHKPPRREPLASPASHRKLPKRLLHLFKQNPPHDSETPLASKRSSSTPSDSSSSGEGEVVYSHTSYPRIEGDHQVDSNPAILRFLNRIAQRLKLELDLDGNDGHTGFQRPSLGHRTHGSSQKRCADNPDQGRRGEKKQKQGQGSRNTGGGGGKKNGGGNGGGKQPPDGHRYPVPPPHSGPQKKPPFACPFHKFDPIRYDGCSSVRLKRPCDVSQHIRRCHLLGDVKQKTANAEPGDNVELVGNAEAEEEVALYCPKCRMEFHGTTAEANLRQHLPCQTPQPATIEQTGMLLPKEFVQLNAARNNASRDIAKWYAMWKACFPNKPIPKSPYFALPGQEAVVETLTVLPEVEVETLAPRSQGGEIIRRALNDCPSHCFFTKDEIDAVVHKVLNGLYRGSSGAEPQTSTETDTCLEVQRRQMPQRQMFQQQISQQPFNGAVDPQAYPPRLPAANSFDAPPTHQLCHNPSAPAPAPRVQVVPQTVPPPATQTSTQTQTPYYGALYEVNDGGFDGTGFPSLEGNDFPTNNGLNDDGFSWWSNDDYQDPNLRYGL